MNIHHKVTLAAAVTGLILSFSSAASASTVRLNDAAEGDCATNSCSTGNYTTGSVSGVGYRSFFTFDLNAIAGRISAATLDLAVGTNRTVGSNTLSLYEYTGDPNSLTTNRTSSGPLRYNALGSGILLGSIQVGPGTSGILSIALNSQALAAIQSAEGSKFTIGGVLSGSNASSDYLFGSSGFCTSPSGAELVLSQSFSGTPAAATPEPATWTLLLTGLACVAFGNIGRKRQK